MLQRDMDSHAGENNLNLVNVSFDTLLNVETNPWIALVDAVYRALEADAFRRTGSLNQLERDRLFEELGGTAVRLRMQESARVDQAAAAYYKAVTAYRTARRKHRNNLQTQHPGSVGRTSKNIIGKSRSKVRKQL